jgi:hypothetical protein
MYADLSELGDAVSAAPTCAWEPTSKDIQDPAGEWSGIAERYSQGERVTGIARYYGCNTPAIHYILKRNKERTAVSNP